MHRLFFNSVYRLLRLRHWSILVLFCVLGVLIYFIGSGNYRKLTTTQNEESEFVDLVSKSRYQNLIKQKIQKAKSASKSTDQQTDVNHNFLVQKNIKDLMLFAWNSYRDTVWGENELYCHPENPGTHGAVDGMVGRRNGLTIIDSLSTLYLMGLKTEFDRGREWVRHNFSFCETTTPVSVFEVNIRLLGGLLSAFSLSQDPMFAQKAIEVAECLSPAFNTATGIPSQRVIPKHKPKHEQQTFGQFTTLADAGTLDLEFNFLSDITGIDTYSNLVSKTLDSLKNIEQKSYTGLIPNTLVGSSNEASLGASGDSFYEYRLKKFVYNRNEKDMEYYVKVLNKAKEHLLTQKENYTCVGPKSSQYCTMEHLACFSGGMYALAAEFTLPKAADWWKLAESITHTCYQSYASCPLHIGQDSFTFDTKGKYLSSNEGHYLLRPEVVESIYYMFYFSNEIKYQSWAVLIFNGLESHVKTKLGVSGVQYSVENGRVSKTYDYIQQSFFLAETLKYLFMIFQEPKDRLDLNRWVFNTEAHPLPTKISPRFKQLQKFKPLLKQYALNFRKKRISS